MAIKTIDEIGDLSAPPGSKEWAIGVKNKLIYLVHQKNSTEKNINPYLDLLEEYQGYTQLENEKGQQFTSLEDFLSARYPFGLSGDVERDNGQYRLRRHGANQYTGNGGDNYHVLRGTTGKPYILARLERDHPDILADYHLGIYRSARQAGIAAGFVKDVKYLQVSLDPKKIAKKLKEKLTKEQIDYLVELLQ